VRTEASMADTLKAVGLILMLSGVLGILVFVPMRRVPLAMLTESVRQLEESKERFRRLTEMSSDWYWKQDTEHRFTSVSSGAERLGIDVAACLGRTRWETGTGIPLEAWAEHRCLLDARQPFRDFEYAIHSTAGEERWISTSGEPTFDARGSFAGYHGTARDQTLRRRAESILRNQKEMLNEMVERKTADLQAALESSQQSQKGPERANDTDPTPAA
jgi:PAS domain S-box-containing protein